MAGADLKLKRNFVKQLKGRVERFHFEVGVLDDAPHKLPLTKAKAVGRLKKKGAGASEIASFLFSNLAGGPARRVGSKKSGKMISEVSESARKQTGVNFYTQPWKSRKNADLLRFLKSFFKLVTESGKLQEKKRVENALQAVVRNPIVRGDYGFNSSVTAHAKGFSRLLIDTGQLFRAIKARVRIKSV